MKQDKALALLKSGENVFLTGSAGTGKTYVLNQYISYLKARKIPVAVTASTGIAATHMNGMTIHSWAGFGIKDSLSRANLTAMKDKKYLREHLENTKVLIIDEISMLHKKQLNMVDEVLKFFREPFEAFGGIQVVLCGDFFQLPPIGNYDEKSKDKFAFMSPAWVEAKFNVCYLTEQYRQSKADELNEILNEIRTRDISAKSVEMLKKAEQNALQEPTKLFTHNYDVDQINQQHLEKLKGRARKFKASTKGNQKLVETLKKSSLAKEILELKPDSKVMFVRNNPEVGYVNGTMGTVIDFSDEGFPVVQTNQNKEIVAKQGNWSIMDDTGKVLASLSQVPLRLAWAITVHKCQGMTLDEAEIDLSKTFEKGQGYVALSRLKNIENLQLTGFNEMSLAVDGLAFKADKRFLELSKEVDGQTNMTELDLRAKAFVKDCGGLTNPKEIEKQSKKNKEKTLKKEKKRSTYDITLDYMKKNMELGEIATERGLSTGTIAGHLIKLVAEHPKEDFSKYKPAKTLLTKVAAAKKKQPKDKPISLKAMFEELSGKVDYNDIKLALAFI